MFRCSNLRSLYGLHTGRLDLPVTARGRTIILQSATAPRAVIVAGTQISLENACFVDQKTARNGLIFGIASYAIWGLIPLYFRPLTESGIGPWEVLAHRVVWLRCRV